MTPNPPDAEVKQITKSGDKLLKFVALFAFLSIALLYFLVQQCEDKNTYKSELVKWLQLLNIYI